MDPHIGLAKRKAQQIEERVQDFIDLGPQDCQARGQGAKQLFEVQGEPQYRRLEFKAL